MLEQFLESGDFLWNSGMFIWSVDAIRSFENLLPEIYDMFIEGDVVWNTIKESEFISNIFQVVKI